MRIEASLVRLKEIEPLRELYRREMNCQIVHDSHHERGNLDSWLLRVDGQVAGYGSIGGYREHPRTTVKELHVLPGYRAAAFALFAELVRASGATRIEVQTNDPLLTLIFHDVAAAIGREKILFEDVLTTSLPAAGATLRAKSKWVRDRIFEHTHEPEGDWLLELNGEVVATGGIMLHYNPPWADLYMEVAKPFRGRGYGSYLVQELKRITYEMGRIPAARCDPSNVASRATLARAGLLPCALILNGSLDRARIPGLSVPSSSHPG